MSDHIPRLRLKKIGFGFTIIVSVIVTMLGACWASYANGRRHGIAEQRALTQRAVADMNEADRSKAEASDADLRAQRNVTWRLLNGEACDPELPACNAALLLREAIALAQGKSRMNAVITTYQSRAQWYMTAEDLGVIVDALHGDETDGRARLDIFRRIVAGNRQADGLIGSLLADTARWELFLHDKPVPLE